VSRGKGCPGDVPLDCKSFRKNSLAFEGKGIVSEGVGDRGVSGGRSVVPRWLSRVRIRGEEKSICQGLQNGERILGGSWESRIVMTPFSSEGKMSLKRTTRTRELGGGMCL